MTGDRVTLTEAQKRARRNRSIGIAVVLLALVVIFYVVAIARMGS